jgi:hypothetical protein
MGDIRITQDRKVGRLTPEEGLALLTTTPEVVTMTGQWQGNAAWAVVFRQSKRYGLTLRFRANLAFWQPPEDMEAWVTETIKPLLLPIWHLEPIGRPSITDTIYSLTVRICVLTE